MALHVCVESAEPTLDGSKYENSKKSVFSLKKIVFSFNFFCFLGAGAMAPNASPQRTEP
jgi:hypothetical protein